MGNFVNILTEGLTPGVFDHQINEYSPLSIVIDTGSNTSQKIKAKIELVDSTIKEAIISVGYGNWEIAKDNSGQSGVFSSSIKVTSFPAYFWLQASVAAYELPIIDNSQTIIVTISRTNLLGTVAGPIVCGPSTALTAVPIMTMGTSAIIKQIDFTLKTADDYGTKHLYFVVNDSAVIASFLPNKNNIGAVYSIPIPTNVDATKLSLYNYNPASPTIYPSPYGGSIADISIYEITQQDVDTFFTSMILTLSGQSSFDTSILKLVNGISDADTARMMSITDKNDFNAMRTLSLLDKSDFDTKRLLIVPKQNYYFYL